MKKHSATFETPVVGMRQGLLALSPMIVFLTLYVVVSLIAGDFYSMPVSVALLAGSIWAVLIYRGHSLAKRIETFSRAAAHTDVMYMIWVFVMAGGFAALATGIGAVDATVNLVLRIFPPNLVLPGMFVAACVVSFAIGTSVGTVVALTPLAVEMSYAGNVDTALFVAVVLGGAFFGDNLSFISDTTIAATRSQGCNMADKFRANFSIVLPAALVALVVYAFMGRGMDFAAADAATSTDAILVVPYLAVIALAVSGVNVMIVLATGTILALLVGAWLGTDWLGMAGFIGKGIDSMGGLIVITLLSAGMLGIIKAAGGIALLLRGLTSHIHGMAGAKACMAALVALVNLCTANNTVAIITVGPVARDIAERYGVNPRTSASLLDTGSCIVQCLIPYGAQTLMATTLAGISPASPIGYQVYPAALALMVILAIFFKNKRQPVQV